MTDPLKESVRYVFDYRHRVPKDEDTHYHVLEHVRLLARSDHPALFGLHRHVAGLGEQACRDQRNPYL